MNSTLGQKRRICSWRRSRLNLDCLGHTEMEKDSVPSRRMCYPSTVPGWKGLSQRGLPSHLLTHSEGCC